MFAKNVESVSVLDIEMMLLDFDIDDSCEHSQHNTRIEVHSGKGVWWQLNSVCPRCGFDNLSAILVCDKWKNAVKGGIALTINCGSCRIPSDNREWDVKFVRKDEI